MDCVASTFFPLYKHVSERSTGSHSALNPASASPFFPASLDTRRELHGLGRNAKLKVHRNAKQSSTPRRNDLETSVPALLHHLRPAQRALRACICDTEHPFRRPAAPVAQGDIHRVTDIGCPFVFQSQSCRSSNPGVANISYTTLPTIAPPI